jgi:hypothetical protein
LNKNISLSIKSFVTIISFVAAIFSIAGFFISKEFNQRTYGNGSPNIQGDGIINVEINPAPEVTDWMQVYEENKPDISKEQFLALKKGMTYDEVHSIVKIHGVIKSNADFGSSYAWGKAPYFYMYATFDADGKLSYAVNNGLF